jgi:hypothetical protein
MHQPPLVNGLLPGALIKEEVVSNFPEMTEECVGRLLSHVQRRLRDLVKTQELSAIDQLIVVLKELDEFGNSIPVNFNKLSAGAVAAELRMIFPARIYSEKIIREITRKLGTHPSFIGQKHIQYSWLLELAESAPYTTDTREEDMEEAEKVPSLHRQVEAVFDKVVQQIFEMRAVSKTPITLTQVCDHLQARKMVIVHESDVLSVALHLHDLKYKRGVHATNGRVTKTGSHDGK